MKHKIIALLLLPIITLLSGCGGGSSFTYSNSTVSFSEGQNIPSKASLSGGLAVETDYIWDANNDKITAIGNAVYDDETTVSATYNASNNYVTAGFSNEDTTLTFDSNDDYGEFALDSDYLAVVKDNGQDYMVLANPYKLDFDYQTYGTWATGAGTGRGEVGALTGGFRTLVADIPTQGIAVYNGETGGRFVEDLLTSGDYGWTQSDFTATADFANREISVATANTAYYDNEGNTELNVTALDITGTLNYNDDSNSFQGLVTNAGALSGTMIGQFYGPNAEEMGGVFALSDRDGIGSIAAYMGGFGAKRQ